MCSAVPAARRTNHATHWCHDCAVADEVLDEVVQGSFAFGAVIARALADATETVTMPQWRVLVLTASGPTNVSAVAEDLQVHPSNATRIVDRLVRAELIERGRDLRDRRNVTLTLTGKGLELVAQVIEHRRRRFEEILNAMDAPTRQAFGASMRAFAEAADRVGVKRPVGG